MLLMLGVGGLQLYGICFRRLVYSEVVEARSSYKKSYLKGFRNPGCGDSTGSNTSWTCLGEVGWDGRGAVWHNLCDAPLVDQASLVDGDSVDVICRYDEYGFSYTGI